MYGPRESSPEAADSFDGFLQALAQEKGATLIRRLVTGIKRDDEKMTVHCADQTSADYDLVVVASGVNSRLLDIIETDMPSFRKPDRTKTFICEFHLGEELIKNFTSARNS